MKGKIVKIAKEIKMEKIKDIPNGFVVLLFVFAIAMIIFGAVRDDYLFYIRAGIFGLVGLFLIWKNGSVEDSPRHKSKLTAIPLK